MGRWSGVGMMGHATPPSLKLCRHPSESWDRWPHHLRYRHERLDLHPHQQAPWRALHWRDELLRRADDAAPDRTGAGSAFCRKYGLTRLALAEPHAGIVEAIRREKALKAWKRAWKIRLIEQANPGCEDLLERLA